LAFSTWCSTPRRFSSVESFSDFSIDTVPTRIGWPLFVTLDDVLDDRVPFGVLGLVDQVLIVGADHLAVRRDLSHVQGVDRLELGELRLGRPGHAGELVVHLEVVLDRDRGEGLVLLLDPNALLSLDRLVQALGVAPALEHAAGELVDDLHLAARDDVFDVAVVMLLGAQRVLQVVDQRRVHVLVQVVEPQGLLDLGDAGLGHGDGLLRLVDLVVLVAPQPGREARERLVPLRAVGHHAADDQRGPSLVDQDRVDLVHDRVGVPALHHVLRPHRHVVAQVVEPELVVGPVGDVGRVGRAPLGRRHLRLDQSDRDAQGPVDRAHPLGVALGQVVVDRDDVHAVGQGIQVGGHRRGQGLALAGLHLGDVALVQGGGPHHLDVEVALPDRSASSLAHAREGLRQEVVQGLALLQPPSELGGLARELGVGEVLDLGFERVDELGELGQLLLLAALAELTDLLDDHASPRLGGFGTPWYRRSRTCPAGPAGAA
jgi:hypothetical protein